MISVIITTKNEVAHLHSCLESIKSQTYPDIEIVVVDNDSRDSTVAIAKKYTKNVFTMGPERSAQRNFGAKQAKGEYLLFLDADMVVSPNVIKDCVKRAKGTIHAVVIPEKSFGVGFWARCKVLERSCYEGVEWMEAARFFRKDAFFTLGGYDELLTGPEDFELPQRLKNTYGQESIGRITSYIKHDEGHLSLAKLLRKKYYYGKKMRRYAQGVGNRAYFSKQASVFLRFRLFFRHPNIFVIDPLHAVAMLVMKILEMSAVAIGSI